MIPAQPSPPDTPGEASSVYVVGAEGLASVKIGTSSNPELRLTRMQTGLPLKLSLLATFPGGRALEKALHGHFGEYRRRGEWFDLTSFGDPVAAVRRAVSALLPWNAEPVVVRVDLDPWGREIVTRRYTRSANEDDHGWYSAGTLLYVQEVRGRDEDGDPWSTAEEALDPADLGDPSVWSPSLRRSVEGLLHNVRDEHPASTQMDLDTPESTR
ncbi:GIY-YIG nuclease family protein [Streptomyces sp. NPDC053720]|uniref:GIY-YIG nuclease family protein n=1 Tax=Streptomyces sp. NPDC053720 TaxID=3154855 RepID=UPI003413F2B3